MRPNSSNSRRLWSSIGILTAAVTVAALVCFTMPTLALAEQDGGDSYKEHLEQADRAKAQVRRDEHQQLRRYYRDQYARDYWAPGFVTTPPAGDYYSYGYYGR